MVKLSALTLLLPEGTNHNTISPFKFDGLKDDILKYGFDEPLQVWEAESKLWVVNGHKRYLALQSVGAPECLIVRKRFADRNEALAYSIRRNQERGQNDEEILARTVKELEGRFDDLDAMEKSLTLTERELYDLVSVDRNLQLPKRKTVRQEGDTKPERTIIKIQMVITPETKRLLERAEKKILRDHSGAYAEELAHDFALAKICEAFLGSD